MTCLYNSCLNYKYKRNFVNLIIFYLYENYIEHYWRRNLIYYAYLQITLSLWQLQSTGLKYLQVLIKNAVVILHYMQNNEFSIGVETYNIIK